MQQSIDVPEHVACLAEAGRFKHKKPCCRSLPERECQLCAMHQARSCEDWEEQKAPSARHLWDCPLIAAMGINHLRNH